MAVSKSLRFQVLRRDNHTCRYCGRSAPEVRLTVDHVVPEALGGTDKPDNLVAACSDCNSGKSATPPDAAHVAQVQDDALRWSAAMQAAADQMLARDGQRARQHEEFHVHWSRWSVPDWALPQDWRASVDSFLAAGLPMEALKSILDVAMERRTVTTENVFRYMAGIAWRKIAELQDAARASLDAAAVGNDEDEAAWQAQQPGRADFACQLLAELEHHEIQEWLSSAHVALEGDEPTDHEINIEAARQVFGAYQARLHAAETALWDLVNSFPHDFIANITTLAREFFSSLGDNDPPTVSVLAWVAHEVAERKGEPRT